MFSNIDTSFFFT